MAETNITTHIVCKVCIESKPLDLFPKMPNGKYGRRNRCKSCSAIYLKKYQEENKDRLKQAGKKRYLENKESYQAAMRENYRINKDAYKARAKKWVEENPERRKEVVSKYNNADPLRRYEKNKKQRLQNPGYYAAAYKARQLRKKQAMPAWADVKSIEAMYRQSAWVSKITGVKHHVDHYYPLKSDIVCGLHVGANLRIIPAKVNLRKHNHFPDQE